MSLTKKQWAWVEANCLGPAMTYASYAARDRLRPSEMADYENLVKPAMEELEKLRKEAPE